MSDMLPIIQGAYLLDLIISVVTLVLIGMFAVRFWKLSGLLIDVLEFIIAYKVEILNLANAVRRFCKFHAPDDRDPSDE